jgi:hypothetical protein
MPDVSVLLSAIDELLEASRKAIRDEALQPIERRLEQAMARAFRTQGRAFLKRFAALQSKLPGLLTDDDWLRYLDAAMLETRELFVNAEVRAVRDAIKAGIRVAASESGLQVELGEAAPPAEEPIATMLGIRFDLSNPRAVEYIDRVGANLVTNIDETTRDYIRTVIKQGVAKGSSYNAMAKLITARYSEFAVGKPQLHIDSRAHLIAITEAGQGYEHGNYMVGQGLKDAGLNMEKSWSTFGDARVSAGCAANEAAGWIPFDDAFPSGDLRPLRFPGCLPAGQIIDAHMMLGCSQRLFNGDLVVVRTSGGKEFSCTPNHPVLTLDGWVGAGDLYEGQQVVVGEFSHAVLPVPGVQDINMPAAIEQVVDALRLSGKFDFHPVKVAAPDFHGDGSGSDVAIIGADSALRNERDAVLNKKFLHNQLAGTDIGRRQLSAKSTFNTFFRRGLTSLASLMSSFRVAGVLFGRALTHHQAVSFQAAATGYASDNQPTTYNAAGDAIGVRERLLRFSGDVAIHDLLYRQRAGLLSIASDKVTSVKRHPYSGHVYNLQTIGGYYSTSTVIVHNCRCSLLMQRVGAGKEEPEPVEKEQGVPRFTSAKEAEEWVRAQGLVSGQVSFKGFSVEASQGVCDSLYANRDIRPEISQGIRNIGNNRELNRIAREARRAEVTKQVTDPGGVYYSVHYSAKRQQEVIEAILRKGDVRMLPNTWAQANYVGAKGADIYISYDLAIKGANTQFNRAIATGFHPEGTGTYKALVDHEIAHEWERLLGMKRDTPLINLYHGHLSTMRQDLSEYARKNIGEFLAEGWAEFLNNPTARPLALAIGQRMLAIIGRP